MWCWALFTLLYFSAVLASAFTKELWFDELVTLYVDRQPTLADVWKALAGSADAMPPLFHILTRAAHGVISNEAAATRFPANVGYWVMCVAVWSFLRRRMPAVHAWTGVAAALLPATFYYATEGRSYGLTLGLAAVAMLLWQRAVEQDRRPIHVAGLAVALCAAVCSHYYAVFLTIPVGLAELYRTRHSGKRDWPVLLAAASILIPLAAHQPLIRAADVYRADLWAAPTILDGPRFYLELLAGIGPAITLALIVGGVAVRFAGEFSQPSDAGLRPVELVFGMGLLAIPLAVLASAFLITHTYFPRYGMAAAIGLMVVSGEASVRALGRRPTAAACFAGALFLALGIQRAHDVVSNWRNLPTAPAMAAVAAATRGPVVVEEAVTYLNVWHYSPAELRSRMTFVVDADAAMREAKLGNPETSLQKLLPYAPLRLEKPEPFLRGHREFSLLVHPTRPSWMLRELTSRGATLEIRERWPALWLLSVRQ